MKSNYTQILFFYAPPYCSSVPEFSFLLHICCGILFLNTFYLLERKDYVHEFGVILGRENLLFGNIKIKSSLLSPSQFELTYLILNLSLIPIMAFPSVYPSRALAVLSRDEKTILLLAMKLTLSKLQSSVFIVYFTYVCNLYMCFILSKI